MYIESVFGNILFEDGSKNLKDCVMNAVLNGIDLSWANLSRTDLFGAEDPTKAGNEMEIQESEFEKLESIQESYYELIMAVENKFPNESRHQTALRLIKEAQGFTQAASGCEEGDLYDPKEIIPADEKEQIAKVCHEVNRAYCLSIGDNSQPPWDEAEKWMKTSTMNGVDLHLNNHSAGPEASHESWMREKLETGWKYGPAKDPSKKEHPCIVPFSELPVEQQAKDFIFRAVVHSLSGTSPTESGLKNE